VGVAKSGAGFGEHDGDKWILTSDFAKVEAYPGLGNEHDRPIMARALYRTPVYRAGLESETAGPALENSRKIVVARGCRTAMLDASK
jgi:hypothetical protein